MKALAIGVGWFIIILITTLYVSSAHAFRCDTILVTEGDSVYHAVEGCGKPAYTTPDYIIYRYSNVEYKIKYNQAGEITRIEQEIK